LTNRTILITGVSSGLGRAFAEGALVAGHTVVGTVRSADGVASFEALAPGRAFGRILDITQDSKVTEVIADAEQHLAPIDVVVASAGYGHEGTLEESTMTDLRRQFDVNVFGTVAVLKAVLPGMRQRRQGRIIVVTSVGGLIPSPTLSLYNGSKFALEGITRSLAAEVARFGIQVTAIEPGAFRTDWSGHSMRRTARTIPDYDDLIGPISAARAAYNGNQPGDPRKAADALLKLIDCSNPPTHLLLGTDAIAAVTQAQAAFTDEIEQWNELSSSTDYAAAA
jgi:NAD(P)-dependent dehydrogenase (short-subunit alcohol dehydrogenase family)